jgi:hypothetical protein
MWLPFLPLIYSQVFGGFAFSNPFDSIWQLNSVEVSLTSWLLSLSDQMFDRSYPEKGWTYQPL